MISLMSAYNSLLDRETFLAFFTEPVLVTGFLSITAGISLAFSNIGCMGFLHQDYCSPSDVDTLSATTSSGFAGILLVLGVTTLKHLKWPYLTNLNLLKSPIVISFPHVQRAVVRRNIKYCR